MKAPHHTTPHHTTPHHTTPHHTTPHHTTLLIKFCTLFFVWIGSILGVQAQQVLTKVNGGASWQALPSTGTDDQNITGCGLSGTNLTIGIENGSSQTVNLASLRDGTGTDNQNITGCALNGTNLTIGIQRGASQTINLASLRDGTGTDDQRITGCALNGTNLTIGIEGGASQTISLASLALMANNSTDDQRITGCALNGTNLTIGIESGLSQTVNLASIRDGNGMYGGSGLLPGNTTVNFNNSNFIINTVNGFTNVRGRFYLGQLTTLGSVVGISGTARSNPNQTYVLHLGADRAAKPTSSTWTITSDARLKVIEGSYDKGLQEILQLNPITYHYKDVGSRIFDKEVKETLSIGFTAQEVREVFPECVSEDEDGYLSLNLHAVNVAYANAIKELHRIILQKRSENLKLRDDLTKLMTFVANAEMEGAQLTKN